MDVAIKGDLTGANRTRGAGGAAADAVIGRHATNPHVRVAISGVGSVATAVNPEVAKGIIAQETQGGIHRTLTTKDEDIRGIGCTDDAREDTRVIVRVNLGITVDTDVAAEGHVIQTEGPETTGVTEAQDSRGSTARRSRVRETNASDYEVIGEGRVRKVSLAAILDDHGRTAELRRRGRRETHGAVRSKGTGRLEKQRAGEADVIAREGRTLGTSGARDVIV